MTTTIRWSWLAAAFCLSLVSPALAGGDAAAGEKKAGVCLSCHTAADFAGQSEAAIGEAIKTKGPGNKEMHPPVGELSDQDVANLAAHLAAASG